jgi:uncharacterized protein (DUF169 family)
MTTDTRTPFKDLSNRLVKALHLETTPVGVLWTTRKPEGIQRLDRTLKGCQFLDVARLEGKLFYVDLENNRDCKNGSHYLGFTPPFEGQYSGDWPAGKFPHKGRSIVRTPVAFRRNIPHYQIVPSGTVKYMVYGPLAEFPFDNSYGGGVVNVFCTAKAGLFLARAADYEAGGATEGTTGPSTCSMVMSKPLMTGEVSYTLGCFGFRQFVQIKPEEVIFGIPFEKMENVVENLELLLELRPDLTELLAEPVGQPHICTEDEIAWQRSPGAILE